jgi:hypothetical protein
MTGRNHPASSVEFLSRLHDGEVPADEKIAFEEHRRSCADCRTAADAFESSLAAFRASDVVPTPADLSARILRKIRSQSPSRRPFGVMFGIDVRWAGLLVAGLLAVLLSAPLVLRKPSSAIAPRPPISATLVEAPTEPKTEDRKAGAPPAVASRQAAQAAPAPAAPPPARPAPEAANQESALQKSAALEAPAEDEHRRFAPAPAAPGARRAPAVSARSRAGEPVGGEAGSAAAAAADDALVSRPPARLLVTALDGEGEAPAIVEGPDSSRFAELRGREYVLTVEASGRIRSIEPSIEGGFVAAPNAKTRPSSAALDVAAPLREIRFAPGDRPRRLAVRVQ